MSCDAFRATRQSLLISVFQEVLGHMNGLDDRVASGGVWWSCGSRGRVHGQRRVVPVECVVADRHGVQVLTEQKPQLLVLSAHVVFVLLQSFSL